MSAAPRRALIVIDVQNEYVTGNLRIQYPPVDAALSCIGRAIDAARAAGVPVVVVQNRAAPTSPLFAHGSHGWALHPVVASRAHDHRVEKTLPSAFTETGLEDWLRARDIDTVAVAGFMTHNCDASTIVDAVHRGFAAEFLADASGSVPYRNDAGFATAEDIHRVFGVVLHSRFAAVVETARWVTAVSRGERLERGSIHASHQAALAALPA
jgi:nicotinamidase-related amidase